MKNAHRSLFCLLLPFVLSLPALRSEVVANGLFCDHAVLQQERPVPVWGTAAEGERVTVSFAGQTRETVAKDGRWMVWLEPMTASSLPQEMVIRGDTNRVTLTDLLVGEVWICSGQSNMERQLGPRPGQKPLVNAVQEAASADYPMIRHFGVARNVSVTPLSTLTGKWIVCTPESVSSFTAVGYYFGRDLHRDLNVPIGLIHTSWGGTPAEAWTSGEVLASNPAFSGILEKFAKEQAAYPERLATYRAGEANLIEDYKAAAAKAAGEGKPAPNPPKPPLDPPKDPHSPSVLFNAMLSPVIPYAVRGVIWYQGEANAPRAKEYRTLFPAMIADWRTRWGEGDFPFLFVQIAPFGKMPPEIREAQLLTALATTNTAMTVITDHGDPRDIHPAEKEPVGDRLALAARALAYGHAVEYSGPLYSDLRIDGSTAVVSFTHNGMGLVARGGPLRGFTIAGADKVFVPAEATIEGNTVRVSSPGVGKPVAVRYGWENVPDVNLFNLAGLPASPFRTDPE